MSNILDTNKLLENKTIADTQNKLKFVKNFEVFDHQVIVHFNYANFHDEIKEYNELFPHDPISDEFYEDELT